MKKTILNLALMLFAVCAFAQAPDWQWATQAGGSGGDNGYEIAIDNNGNSYVTGSFWDTATFGSFSLTGNGVYDIFVAKLDANGNWLWATQAGGNGSDQGSGIAIDDNGNSYVTGYFSETATFGSYSLTSSGEYDKDIYVAKMDANGNWLWAVQAGGIGYDYGLGIAIDDNENSYLTGSFMDTATFGSYSITSSGDSEIFVAKMDANGNWLWATHAGGSGDDNGYEIAIDDNGNSYLTGYFSTTATFGSHSITSSGFFDIFAARMDANGNWLWAVQAGGFAYDYGLGIAIDDNENSYLTGVFSFTATFGSYSLTSSEQINIFVAKMDANGNWLWATQAGGNDSDHGSGITIDDNGNSYVTGRFSETATFGSYSLTSSGQNDIFVAKMDANGNWLWVVQAGGNSSDHGSGITIDDNGNSYVTGRFSYSATFGSYSFISSGVNDIFVAKLGNDASVENEIMPTDRELSNYPNPFNPETNIVFNLPEAGEVQLDIYSIKGQKIKSLLNDQITAGEHSIVWNGENFTGKKVSSGIYFYKLITPSATHTKKMLLLK